MAKKRGLWIQSAIKRPGQLHRDLGIPQGQKIPSGTLAAAAKEPGKVGQRARLAQTMKGFGGGKKKSPMKMRGTALSSFGPKRRGA